jgi:hypothetical protein
MNPKTPKEVCEIVHPIIQSSLKEISDNFIFLENKICALSSLAQSAILAVTAFASITETGDETGKTNADLLLKSMSMLTEKMVLESHKLGEMRDSIKDAHKIVERRDFQ